MGLFKKCHFSAIHITIFHGLLNFPYFIIFQVFSMAGNLVYKYHFFLQIFYNTLNSWKYKMCVCKLLDSYRTPKPDKNFCCPRLNLTTPFIAHTPWGTSPCPCTHLAISLWVKESWQSTLGGHVGDVWVENRKEDKGEWEVEENDAYSS